MALRSFITPKSDSGAVNLRTAGKIDPGNIVGTITPGVRVEYVGETGAWFVGKVYVSTQGAEAINGQIIRPKAFNDFVNIRTSPVVENNTDVGDLKQGQQLELISASRRVAGGPHLSVERVVRSDHRRPARRRRARGRWVRCADRVAAGTRGLAGLARRVDRCDTLTARATMRPAAGRSIPAPI